MKYWVSMVNTEEVDQFVAIAQKAEELAREAETRLVKRLDEIAKKLDRLLERAK